jgi:hypothetical protein
MKTPYRNTRKLKIAFIPFATIIWVDGWGLIFLNGEKNLKKQAQERLKQNLSTLFLFLLIDKKGK